jgi:hypothetical protein
MMSATNRERAPFMNRPGKKPEAPFNMLSLVPMTYRVMAVSCIFLAALNLAAFVLHSLALSLFVRCLQLFRPFVDLMALYVPAISQISSYATTAENNDRIATATTLLACDWAIVAPALLLMLVTSIVQFCLSGPSINWLVRKRLNERNITMFELFCLVLGLLVLVFIPIYAYFGYGEISAIIDSDLFLFFILPGIFATLLLWFLTSSVLFIGFFFGVASE